MAGEVVGFDIRQIKVVTPNSLAQVEVEAWRYDVESILRHVKIHRAQTSGATSAVLFSIPTRADTVYGWIGWVLGRRHSGGGSVNDAYVRHYHANYKNISGTVTALDTGGFDTIMEEKDNASFNSSLGINGNAVEMTVTGVAGMEMVWLSQIWIHALK